MSLKNLAQEVLLFQDEQSLLTLFACWSQAASKLRKLFPELSKNEFNHHPINVLYACKLEKLINFGITFKSDYSSDDDCYVDDIIQIWVSTAISLKSNYRLNNSDNQQAIRAMFAKKVMNLCGPIDCNHYCKVYSDCCLLAYK